LYPEFTRTYQSDMISHKQAYLAGTLKKGVLCEEMGRVCIIRFFSVNNGNGLGPLWEIDRDSFRHQIQIEDLLRTGVLMCLPVPCSTF
jgi:hypothetical protein